MGWLHKPLVQTAKRNVGSRKQRHTIEDSFPDAELKNLDKTQSPPAEVR